MKRCALVACAGLFLALRPATLAQELTLEEVRVEAPFDATLELPRDATVSELLYRLELRASEARARELEKANASAVTRLLDLTQYIPIPLGSSDSKLDTFLQQNYMRADLNPHEQDPLSLREKRTAH
ncbi:MAG: hypothetical protein ACR2ID_07720 [Chthoniobacterales bacterium]